MAINTPFALPGHWYRGNTHTHTTASDGRLSLHERCAAYRQAGYDFLVVTDHRTVNDVTGLSSPDFLVISGIETHPANPFGGDLYHIVGIDVHERIDCSTLSANAVIAEINRQGGLAVICHPYWCGHSLLDLLPLDGYFAMEVYNDTCAGIGKAFSEQSWDELLDKAGPTFGLASDDCHGTAHDCFHGWTMLKAPALTLDAVKTALRTGAFYATTGPLFEDITFRDVETKDANGAPVMAQEITVTCSPVKSIMFKGRRSYGWRVLAPEGETLTTASFTIPPGAFHYLRVEVTDGQGKRAWSNPFWL